MGTVPEAIAGKYSGKALPAKPLSVEVREMERTRAIGTRLVTIIGAG
jgi:hypothetical protein